MDSDGRLTLYVRAKWRFLNIRQAFTTTTTMGHPSRALLLYSDVVWSNAVGYTEHHLVQELPYKNEGSGSFYFEPKQVKWMPLGRPYFDVIEVQIADSQGALVTFGSGKTIVTFRFWKIV